MTITKIAVAALLFAITLAVAVLEYRVRSLNRAASACGAHVFVSSYAEDIVTRTIGRQQKRVTSLLRHFLRYPVGVNASGKTLTPELISEIAGQRSIRALTFSYCPNFDDQKLAALTRLPNLDTLIVHHTAVTDASAPALKKFAALRRIELNACNVSDPTVEALATLYNLNHLGLEQTAITPAALAHFGKFPSLTYLDLKNTKTDDTLSEAIAPLRSLTYLDLANTAVTDTLATTFPPLPELRTIILTNTGVTSAAAPTLTKKLPSLENLQLP